MKKITPIRFVLWFYQSNGQFRLRSCTLTMRPRRVRDGLPHNPLTRNINNKSIISQRTCSYTTHHQLSSVSRTLLLSRSYHAHHLCVALQGNEIVRTKEYEKFDLHAWTTRRPPLISHTWRTIKTLLGGMLLSTNSKYVTITTTSILISRQYYDACT